LASTLLIGLDGGTFRIFDPLMDDGTMPSLAALVRDGARADLLSTPNPLTPPAWTSLMTGRTPGEHGIFDFLRVEERGDELFFTLHDGRDVRAETVWSILSRHERRVAVLNFPLTAPPEPVRGAVVPGLVSWKHLRRSTWPEGLYERLKTLPGFNPKEFSWDFDLETRAVKQVDPSEYADWIRFHIRRERHWFEIARHLMAAERPDVAAVLFDGTDKLQHLCWRFIDPAAFPQAPSAWERSIRDLCLEYFRQLDGFIRDLAALAGPGARIFLASDHGFGPTHQVFRVNTWLQEEGLLAWKETDATGEAAGAIEQRLKSDVAFVDLRRTKAYARTSASNGIAIRVARTPGAGGIAPAEYEAFRARLADRLLTVRNPETSERVVRRVLLREEAFPGRLSHRAPDLTLVLEDGGFVSIGNKTPSVVSRPEVAGTHRPEGIFVAAGEGIAKGRLRTCGIVDVAAALLHSAGVPIPADFEGRLPVGAFDPEWLRAHPMTQGPNTRPPSRPDAWGGEESSPGYAPEEEAVIAGRLQALGYLE
jgi:predicted AlkP superfamily phosphohydrolase/phosphomutase